MFSVTNQKIYYNEGTKGTPIMTQFNKKTATISFMDEKEHFGVFFNVDDEHLEGECETS